MACCNSSPHSKRDIELAVSLPFTPSLNLSDDEDIVYEKRPLKLDEIEEDTSYRLALRDWTKELEASERKLERKLANWSSSRSDVYQILGLFFVFQGVIITAVAQSSLLDCHNWWLVFSLSLIAFVAAIGATVQKLNEIAEYREQHLVEKKVYSSLRTTIDELKEQGLEFDLGQGQPELAEGYTKKDNFGEGSFARRSAAVKCFCRVWVCSYAGAVLLLLCAFSVITLLAIPRILCHW